MRVKALVGLYAIILMSALLQACCEEEFKYTGIRTLEAYTLEENEMVSGPDTVITGPFSIHVYYYVEQIAQSMPTFVSSSYATSCSEVYANELNESAMSLSTDKTIYLQSGDSLEAGVNILQTGLVSSNHRPYSYATTKLEFNETFFELVDIDGLTYTFQVSTTTDDGIEFQDDITLTFSL